MSMTQSNLHDEQTPTDANFHSLVDSVSNYAIYMLDAAGYVMSWNSGAQHINQYTASEIIGRHFSTFFTEADRAAGEPELILRAARTNGKYEATGWRVRKDGSKFLAGVAIDAVYNSAGAFIGYAKVTRDIGEQQRIERKMREGSMLKALVETAADGVLMLDASGVILMSNPACERLFGYRAEELTGKDFKMLFAQSTTGDLNGYVDDFRRNGTPKCAGSECEATGCRKDGIHFPMAITVGEAIQNNETIFVTIVHDLTARKRAEEQLAQALKMEAVGQLSGGIAHDFNNLLTVIIGNADLLAESVKVHPELKHFCETIISAGERGAELTRHLLAFSRRQTLQPVVTDCGKLVENMRNMLRRTLSADIDVRISCDPNLAQAFADPTQLESAVLNLAINARDAMPLGGHLNITLSNAKLDKSYSNEHPEVKPGDYVMIAVTDDGEGMSSEVRERVFEPFFTTKEVGEGSGLGLSMIYGFMKQSNGHVTLYSAPALGTTVRLYLPAAISAEFSERETKQPTDLSSIRGTETVLVVEDDPFVRGHAVTSLTNFGYHVLTAVDGREALMRLAENPGVDLLFSDVVLPGGITGVELAEMAQHKKPNLKILLTSGYPAETLASRFNHKPRLSLLNKPYRKIDLGRRLREVLNESENRYRPRTYSAGLDASSTYI
jgi:PAS domain S-box-containing protein